MTLISLVAAVAIGVAIGLCGRWLVPSGRNLPFWVPLAVAVGAAVLGSITASLAGVDASPVSVVAVVLEITFAAAAVTLVAATADRGPSDSRYDHLGRNR